MKQYSFNQRFRFHVDVKSFNVIPTVNVECLPVTVTGSLPVNKSGPHLTTTNVSSPNTTSIDCVSIIHFVYQTNQNFFTYNFHHSIQLNFNPMAEICCGVVGEEETLTLPVEPSSRPSGRRSLDLLPLKYMADPPENSRKRQKLDPSVSPPPPPARECENAVDSCESSTDEESKENEVVLENKVVVVEECSPKYGITSVCGRRREMEDAVSVHPSFCREKRDHFFGVYDGHGCSHVIARNSNNRYHKFIIILLVDLFFNYVNLFLTGCDYV